MVVLALDTTTRVGSCAVARDGVVVRERTGDPDRPHDVRLPADLMAVLSDAGVALADVDAYAAATGPGSFTGLRIGIATMQGLAFAAGKPLVGVSAFDALARMAAATLPPDLPVATWIDAWRGEVYATLYGGDRQLLPPTVAPPDAWLHEVLTRAPSSRMAFIGDAAAIYAPLIRERFQDAATVVTPAAPPLAGTIAVLATEALRAGHAPPPHAIRPLYVRRPDAELARDARPVR